MTSGPDRGRVFEVDEELIHIGCEEDAHEIVLSAPDLSGHLATIMNRGGRYAISTPVEDLLQVDESTIPVDRWVWLPEQARVRIGRQTAFQFQAPAGSSADRSAGLPQSESDSLGRATPPPARRTARKAAKVRRPPAPAATAQEAGEAAEPGSRGAKTAGQPGGRRLARFITDHGETLVRLGEDGQLPELKLSETTARKADDGAKQTGGPVLLYAVLGLSFVMSIAMVVIDASPVSDARKQQELARQLITRYYGTDEADLKPYQRLLREAQLARSRNDPKAEREAYREVLELLNSEDTARSFTGLTGARSTDDDRDLGDRYYNRNQGLNDRELRRLISALLNR